MKRRYKRGDWLRVPLGAEHDALGIITHACRSRLFGYFFAWPARVTPSHAQLAALEPQQSVLATLFGGAPLEDERWSIVARSLSLDTQRWTFPDFALRGAFGASWKRVRLDQATMQPLEAAPATRDQVCGLPNVRFGGADEVEHALRERIEGIPAASVLTVCEARPPFDEASLSVLSEGGRLQTGEPLDEQSFVNLAKAVASFPGIELRVHGGYPGGFDATLLRPFRFLRSLILDVRHVRNFEALALLARLQRLRFHASAAVPIHVLSRLPELHALEIHGSFRASDIARCEGLRVLRAVDAGRLDLAALAPLDLHELALSHAAYDFAKLPRFAHLQRLELCDVALEQLPPLDVFPELRTVVLHGVRLLRDLRALARIPNLRELRIEAMPQLEVSDFQPLTGAANLRDIAIDAGSRAKSREAYRLLRTNIHWPRAY